APVLRVLFGSDAFRASKGQKVLRPMQDVVATLRILGVQPGADDGDDGTGGLYWLIESMSDAPLAWALPNGYPDDATSWRSAGGTLNRWNGDRAPAAGLVQTLAGRLLFRRLAAAHRDAICAFIGRVASDPVTSSSEAVGWRL